MPTAGSYQDIDFDHGHFTKGELQAVRRTLAKRANQRIVRAERAVSKISGKSYGDIGATAIVKEELRNQGRRRFTETLDAGGKNMNQLRHEINVLQSFLNSKSSTVKGLRAIENARVRTFQSGAWTGGTKLSDVVKTKEFYDFLNSQAFATLSESLSSGEAIKLYDQYDKVVASREQLNKAFEEYSETKNQTYKGLIQKLNAISLKGSSNR